MGFVNGEIRSGTAKCETNKSTVVQATVQGKASHESLHSPAAWPIFGVCHQCEERSAEFCKGEYLPDYQGERNLYTAWRCTQIASHMDRERWNEKWTPHKRPGLIAKIPVRRKVPCIETPEKCKRFRQKT